MNPLFSIIIPTHNRKDLLARTLRSVQSQDFTDYELIVVDDGSNDGTAQFLLDEHPSLVVLHQQNCGPGSARNLGAGVAAGRYIAFLDCDDLWFPWTLDTYRRLIAAHGDPSFIVGKPFRFKSEAELGQVSNQPVACHAFEDYLASGDEWRWWGASSFVIRRDVYVSVGGFCNDHINGEDADLALKLGEARGFVQVLSPATFGYREHEASARSNIQRTLDGLWHMVDQERSGRYPGGIARATERRRIITRHVRPATLECLKRGEMAAALHLYAALFPWHLSLGRWKYLGGFPVAAIVATTHPSRRGHEIRGPRSLPTGRHRRKEP